MSSQPPTALERGEEHNRLYNLAMEKKPELNLENETCGIAIYSFDTNDFHWLKGSRKYSIAKLKTQCLKIFKADIEIRYGNIIPTDSTQICDLVTKNQEIAVFTAHLKDSDVHLVPPSIPSSSSSSIRSPLRLVDTTLPASFVTTNRNEKATIKSKSDYSSPPHHMQRRKIAPPVQRDLRMRVDRVFSPQRMASATPSQRVPVERDCNQGGITIAESIPQASNNASGRLQKIMEERTPEQLEAEVRDMQILLEAIKKPLAKMVSEHQDTKHWVERIDQLLNHTVDTPTVIGVVGNTGVGKSSVINAILEEERLVPTNCMRACTAVVTEISWNPSDEPSAKYRAEIEFINAADWKTDLELSLFEMINPNGQLSGENNNKESEARIAYAKLKAVYPHKTKQMLAECTVETLLSEPAVQRVLGTTMTIERPISGTFYKALQDVIDSKEKKKGDKKEMDLWPLIKVVKLYTKADALSTGAVIVDLPGLRDSNAARAAVAAAYMKQCTNLFVVAPISRAVDDKTAKSLLGESFKRQLKVDGTYSRITFICSKTDDISITEALETLRLAARIGPDSNRIGAIDKKVQEQKQLEKDLQDSEAAYSKIFYDCDDKIERWEEFQKMAGTGKNVRAPISKKRRRDLETRRTGKRVKSSKFWDLSDDFVDDGEGQEADGNNTDDSDSGEGGPLTLKEIEEQIARLKEEKKRARSERDKVGPKLKSIAKKIDDLTKERARIEADKTANCIEHRNSYCRSAIQQDFADGIRELDIEDARGEDADQYNPETQIRDYDELARSLPVFCVSSRAYQKLSGRFLEDSEVSGFRSANETEIPQLQAHCKKSTEDDRAANCGAFLTNCGQLLTSLRLWAANDGSANNLPDDQLELETTYLKTRLVALDNGLQASVKDTLTEINQALAKHIFDNYKKAVDLATKEALKTCGHWHRKPNHGGYNCNAYRAIMKRRGVYSNDKGPHDFNFSLAESMIKKLASQWERVFARRLPQVIRSFTSQSKNHLSAFHHEIKARSTHSGLGVAAFGLLSRNLRNYEGIFKILSKQVLQIIKQRDANREFTPVIQRRLRHTYFLCASQSGKGSFARSKEIMEDSIEEKRKTMFWDGANEVKSRLELMCGEVEDTMLARSEEVHVNMSRDYLSVMSRLQKADAEIRAKVLKCIERQARIISDAKKGAMAATQGEEEDAEAEQPVAFQRGAKYKTSLRAKETAEDALENDIKREEDSEEDPEADAAIRLRYNEFFASLLKR